MKADDTRDDRLVSAVRDEARRKEKARHGSFWRGFGLIGTVGWLIVLPALAGLVLGRLLDTYFHSGLFWTLPLLVIGLVIGCLMAWRQIEEVIR